MRRVDAHDVPLSRRAFGLGAVTSLVTLSHPAWAFGAEPTRTLWLRGVGASVPHPIYLAWADRFGPELGIKLGYVPLGSGTGLRAARNREADFGGSDIAMPRVELERADLEQVPIVAAALGFAVHLPGIDVGRLRLRRDDVRAIFEGEIRVWSDARLRAGNPGLALPDLAITPVVRRDVSGSSRLAAAWLAGQRSNAQAKDTPFTATPGLAVFGAHGVAQTVRRLRGSIGYLEFSTARLFGLEMLDLELADGGFSTWQPDHGATAHEWPLLTRTRILIPRAAALAERSNAVARFFRHCLLHGGELAISAGFVPLPAPVRAASLAQLERVLGRG
ncbi:phosphate ABC transporter substrate-binding protein, PhoT family [Roseovarius litoreus]|uniref:Phosphate-binding protein PstS n=1 Tax=Roseovarius litoreus TaxID=1155722 RepID=A0A1M7EGT2_9RHOB|nr:substrate-binding domain-containing protein [Roseovarius litoreus]SHL90944.1 phosphate ABC transporter substrate-binding protein, PhoT family [Roseovarius litoreus]